MGPFPYGVRHLEPCDANAATAWEKPICFFFLILKGASTSGGNPFQRTKLRGFLMFPAFILCRKPLETPGNPWKPRGNCTGNPDSVTMVLSHKNMVSLVFRLYDVEFAYEKSYKSAHRLHARVVRRPRLHRCIALLSGTTLTDPVMMDKVLGHPPRIELAERSASRPILVAEPWHARRSEGMQGPTHRGYAHSRSVLKERYL